MAHSEARLQSARARAGNRHSVARVCSLNVREATGSKGGEQHSNPPNKASPSRSSPTKESAAGKMSGKVLEVPFFERKRQKYTQKSGPSGPLAQGVAVAKRRALWNSTARGRGPYTTKKPCRLCRLAWWPTAGACGPRQGRSATIEGRGGVRQSGARRAVSLRASRRLCRHPCRTL